jgi:hypothetical protein
MHEFNEMEIEQAFNLKDHGGSIFFETSRQLV